MQSIDQRLDQIVGDIQALEDSVLRLHHTIARHKDRLDALTGKSPDDENATRQAEIGRLASYAYTCGHAYSSFFNDRDESVELPSRCAACSIQSRK